MRVRLTDAASDDLRDIRAYISTDSPLSAQRVVADLIRAVDSLSIFPSRGRNGSRPGTRELVVRSYVIVYRVRLDEVEITRVRHHAERR